MTASLVRRTLPVVAGLLSAVVGCSRPAPAPVPDGPPDAPPVPVLGTLTGAARPGAARPDARFVREVPWAGRGVWLKADLHTHTTFSDGSHTVAEVVAKAAGYGCDVMAVTDHGDTDRKAVTPDYFAAIRNARGLHPDRIILAGLEWNPPPWAGREHATVLVHPQAEQQLTPFKLRFDHYKRPAADGGTAAEALRWLLEQATADETPPVVILNHPSRKTGTSFEHVPTLTDWRAVNDLVIGFEGAPGHQGAPRLGSYPGPVKPLYRWDPAAARVDDAWDALLKQGLDVWAALASSDFHNADPKDLNDRWPGQFSETWVYAPDRTPGGVLRALRAGSFFAAHGHIVRGVELRVAVPGLPRPAGAGEVVVAAAGAEVAVEIHATVPPTDWAGQPNRLDEVELIGVTPEGARVLARAVAPPASGPVLAHRLTVPASGIVLRARGRRGEDGAPDLMFQSNPVRIRAAGSP